MGKIAFIFFGVTCAAAWGQHVDRVFHLKQVTSTSGLQEISTTLRTVGEIRQVDVDVPLATMSIAGTADQIAFAEWLIPKLDVAVGSSPRVQQYRFGSDDFVLVFALANTNTTQGVQELITNLRTVADIQRVYMVHAPRMVTLRGNASLIALANFLIPELDKAETARQSATAHPFQMTGTGRGGNDTVVVYGLAHTNSNLSLQETITALRTVLDIQRIYNVSAPKLLTIRGDAALVKMAEWLTSELDRETASTGTNQIRMPGGNDDVVSVLYLEPTIGGKGIQELLTTVRATAHISKAYMHTAPAALILRGTADQIAMAGKMIQSGEVAAK